MPTVGATTSRFTLPTADINAARGLTKRKTMAMVNQESIGCLLMSLVIELEFVFEFEFSCIRP